MTEQEQIEKMANCNPCYERYGECPIKDRTNCTPWTRAVNQYEQGYRKIPKDALVLLIGKDNQPLDEKTIEYFVNHNQEIRKETAKEILQNMKEKCKELEDKFSHICKSKKECLMETCRYEGVLAVKRELYELAKEYGVEVK